jgi:C1A family cysteine protease
MLTTVDLRWMMSPVRNQDNVGACVSFALVACFEAIGNKTGTRHNLSELFLYYTARTYGEAYISSAIGELEMIGVCNETIWPYDEKNVNVEPSQAAFNNASMQKIMKAFCVGKTKDDLKAVLNAGYPVIISFPVCESFFSIGKNGIVPLPQTDEPVIGGHAVLAVGYNENFIICKNSWGIQFGDNGYFYLPYEYEQLLEFCVVSTQIPLQQVFPLGQTLLHAPQLSESCVIFLHALPHCVYPESHVMPHIPVMHVGTP